MKILNIFKKANLKNTVTKKSNSQTLDKKQLEKVIGGDGESDLKKMKDSVIQNIR